MSNPESPFVELRRLISSTGIYAAAAVAQRGVGFLLIPIYTRLIDPTDYGMLEIFNVFSSIAFAFLSVGLASAINKCYHRDCSSPGEQASILPTALLLDLPVLVGGSAVLLYFATPISHWLIGRAGAESLFVLVVFGGVFFGTTTLVLASLRAQERALAFGALSLAQFAVGLLLNIVLVVYCGWGVRGILWGNLASNAVALPIALAVAKRGVPLVFDRRLARPLLSFGALIIPVTLAAWTMDLSDRYVLRLFRDLGEVAIYGVGYKFGMMLDLAVVWPFQLAWPAFAFAISRREGHKETYARTMTYLVAVLTLCVLVLSLLSGTALPPLVGEQYRQAFRVVPIVALAYAFNGLQYCFAPGVHIAGYTKYLTAFSAIGALLNLALNLLLIPPLGMMGAAWSTLVAFASLALMTGFLAQRVYPIRYEYGRLIKIPAAAALAYLITAALAPLSGVLSLAWSTATPVVVFSSVLIATGFLDANERTLLRGVMRRLAPI